MAKDQLIQQVAAQDLTKAAGFEIPEDRKFIVIGDGIGHEYMFSHEKLTTYQPYINMMISEALAMVRGIFEVGGKDTMQYLLI